ncbi:MASE3 domain-containing protein [Pseudobacteroides cellulosolvens]|uniref:Serine phosphatase n=1 Tax=Pseudobacteroides cellulosolvens ATCC 35603 = DSM 2933 TaxID=398512 RepID=A0A0L6JJV8_9FIRM|nr:MASE3 domain-containing protein [Pseudobacteroides cellulosolvens]KNY26166.1 serine phosphatase [Pseudobacteroides cellulosolvens ATCC 35603 = DSM 2933]
MSKILNVLSVKNLLKYIYEYKQLVWLGAVIVFSSVLFEKIYLLEPFFDKTINVSSYLSWHTIFEFISILVSLCVFILSYYAYRQNHSLRGIFIANVFLTMGIIDTFHTLSFKGMPYFLIENSTADRATTYWIIARLIGAIGIAAGSFIKRNKKSNVNRRVFLFFTVSLSMVILVVVTYFPYFLPAMYIEGVGVTGLKKVLEYMVILCLCFAGIMFLQQYIRRKDNSSHMFAIAITASIFSELAFVMYTSVYDIYNYIGHVYKFISYFIVFRVAFINNIEKPYLALYKAKNKLKVYAGNLNKLVDERTKELYQMNKKLLEDLEYARDIQKGMLPHKLPNNEQVKFDAKYYPAETVSGDFYNVLRLDDHRIGMYIGDVSGHGVSAAMLTIFLNQSIKTIRELEGNRFEVIKPSEVLENLYKLYNKVNFKDEMYILLLYAIYNMKTMELEYSSAGMNVQPIIVKKNGEIMEMDIKGLPICDLINIYSPDYIDNTIKLESGDKMFFYTDGLIELNDKHTGEAFTKDRLKRLLADCEGKEICEEIDRNIKGICSDGHQKDDVTFLVMQVN